jgi:hypothetical protein
MRGASLLFLLGGLVLLALARSDGFEGPPLALALFCPLLIGTCVGAALAPFLRLAALFAIAGTSLVMIVAATAPGASFAALVAGALMCAVGAHASLSFTGVRPATDIDVVADHFVEGRRYVYENDRAVAIETWKDGGCVLSTPVIPHITKG